MRAVEDAPRLRTRSLACALWLLGCATTTHMVHEQAAADLQCPQEQLSVQHVGKGRFEVEGCSARADYRCATSALGRTRCQRQQGSADLAPSMHEQAPVLEPSLHEQRVRHKAASLLACDASALRVSAGEGGRFAVEGCGRSVGYECATRNDCCAFATPGVQSIEEVARARNAEADDAANAKGSLLKKDIKAVLDTALGEVRRCYETTLSRSPAPAGIVAVKFIIEPDGRVRRAAVERSSLDRPAVESCIRHLVLGLRFPEPEGGGIVVVTYPYVLTTSGPYLPCP